jgi:hypothetical protein
MDAGAIGAANGDEVTQPLGNVWLRGLELPSRTLPAISLRSFQR